MNTKNALNSTKQPLVLVVDDSPTDRMLMKMVLEKQGLRVEEAGDGEEAIGKVETLFPDVVLTDVIMPRMNGFELCKKMKLKQKETNRYIPVIMMTGYLDPETHDRALAAGVDEFLTKPVETMVILTRVRSLLKIKELYEKVQNAYEKLQESEKMKEDLVQMVAHDMKNPLTAIRGYSELIALSQNLQKDPKTADFVKKLDQSCNDLMRMLLNFLDISRMEAGNFQLRLSRVDVGKVIETVVNRIKPLAEKTMKNILVMIEDKEVFVEADRDLIERVILNLIDNAVKYSPPQSGIRVSLKHADSHIHFAVQDQGEGIPPELHDKIFEKFNRVRELTGHLKTDTGLGLAFCKLAVELHHGKIWVESAVGKGSCFYFNLPAQQEMELQKTA